VLAGCNGSTDEPLLPCDDGVFVNATTGTTPTFSWNPACLISRIAVADSAGTILWDVQTTASVMAPPLVYGQTPDGAVVHTTPGALVAGRSYSVGVYRSIGLQQDDIDLVGAESFRP